MEFQGKILVADDEKVNVEFFKVMLSKLGFTVEAAYDGKEVMQKLTEFTPDLILLDLLMPKMSGFQVAKTLKQDSNTKDIPIIVLTAVSDIDKKVDMLELGIDDYIIKPFNFIEILARIRSTLRAKAVREELHESKKKLESLNKFEEYFECFLDTAYADSKAIVQFVDEKLVDSGQGERGQAKIISEKGKSLLESIENLKRTYRYLMK